MIYVASPYTSPDKTVVRRRFRLVEAYVARKIRVNRGELWFSPIVYTHNMAERYGLPGDAAFWFEFNFDFMARANRLVVLQLDGWKESVGVSAEIAFAKTHGMRIDFDEIDLTDVVAALDAGMEAA